MLHGDISNKSAPYVAFDIDSLLFKDEKPNMVSRFLNMFKTDEAIYLSKPLNKEFIKIVERVWYKHNVCVIFTCFSLSSDESKRKLLDILVEHNIPFTSIDFFNSWEEVRNAPYMYFFTNNENMLSYVSSKHAMKLENIWEVL